MAGPRTDLRALAGRIERAQAEQLHRTGPGSSLDVAGGRAVMKGPRSPFSAALGVGLGGPVTAEDLDRIEAHLGVGGGPVRVELTPFADASLAEQLGRRGYAVERFHQVWVRPPLPLPEARPVEVRQISAAEEAAWIAIFAEAVLGAAMPSAAQRTGLSAMTRARGNACFLCWREGAPVGVAIASALDGVGLLTGAGVPPRLRGAGLQRALVRARLAWAAERGCDVAASATEVGTASAATLARCGFAPAYPKVVMARAGAVGSSPALAPA